LPVSPAVGLAPVHIPPSRERLVVNHAFGARVYTALLLDYAFHAFFVDFSIGLPHIAAGEKERLPLVASFNRVYQRFGRIIFPDKYVMAVFP
jgi:hypothetical protein